MNIKEKLKLCWRILREKESPMSKHTDNELSMIENEADDEMQDRIGKDIREIICVLCTQGHSNISIDYLLEKIAKLAYRKPLIPLTGNEAEWVHVGDDLYRNKRCQSVLKNKDGAWDNNGYVFADLDGYAYTSRLSRKPIDFPYMPKSTYIREGTLGYIWFRVHRYFGFN